MRPEVSEAVIAKLKEFTPEKVEQFQALLQDQRSVRKLADATLNDEKVVTSDNAQHLLDLMRDATAAEVQSKYEAQMDEEKKKHEKAQRSARVKQSGEIADRDEQVRKLQEQLELQTLHSKRIQRNNDGAVANMVEAVNRRSRRFRTIVAIAVLGVGALVLLNEFFRYLPDTNVYWKAFGAVATLVGAYEWIAEKMDWPTFAYRSVANVYPRIALRQEIKRRGLSWISIDDFAIADGAVQRVPLTIEHEVGDSPS